MPEHDEPMPSRAQRLLLKPEPLQELLFDAARIARANMIPALASAGTDIECTDASGNGPNSLDCRNNAAIVLLDIATSSVKALDG
ncbi:hypothetical protein [Novosphingobium sp.]|uniref:hypothetical protein n=1 Tax=Novosphingobium sp. TaxID=1874826 RepID=UPI0028AB748E|nr:hypothetical protein [Novosphingobium sp.]